MNEEIKLIEIEEIKLIEIEIYRLEQYKIYLEKFKLYTLRAMFNEKSNLKAYEYSKKVNEYHDIIIEIPDIIYCLKKEIRGKMTK